MSSESLSPPSGEGSPRLKTGSTRKAKTIEPDDGKVTVEAVGGNEPLGWHHSALCAQVDLEVFFPEKGGSTAEAKQICSGCTVKAECLADAYENENRFGIWGGFSERERRRLFRSGGFQPPAVQTRVALVSLQDGPINASPTDSALPLAEVHGRPLPHRTTYQSTTNVERFSLMKDDKRFPAVKAWLMRSPNRTLEIGASANWLVPQDLKQAAHVHSSADLRRVIRRMDAQFADISVETAPNGALTVRLLEQAAVIEPSESVFAAEESLRPKETPVSVAPADELDETVDLLDTVLADVDLIVEEAMQEQPEPLDAAELSLDTADPDEAEVVLLPIVAANNQPEVGDEPSPIVEGVSNVVPETDPVVTPELDEPSSVKVDSFPFVEREFPRGYHNPPPNKVLLYADTPERRRIVFEFLLTFPGAIVHNRSISGDLARLFGSSDGAAGSLLQRLVSLGLVGREMVAGNKVTRHIWLRQAGWDWLKRHGSTVEFIPAATQLKAASQDQTPDLKAVGAEPPVREAEGEPLLEQEKPVLLSEFVEFPLPAGYTSPAPIRTDKIRHTEARQLAVLQLLVQHPGAYLRNYDITPDVMAVIGCGDRSAQAFVQHLVANDYLGRIGAGRRTKLVWLRQAGWDWLKEHEDSTAFVPVHASKEDPPSASNELDVPGASLPYDVLDAQPDRLSDLHLAPAFDLPIEAVVKCFGIFGNRGSGKTTSAVVMMEEMVARGWPTLVMDPQGVWWGLRSSADGERPGLPIVILGGSHADAPLEVSDAYVVASLLDNGICSLVLDVSDMDDDERIAFTAALFKAIFNRKHRTPIHVVVDEADLFVPRTLFDRELIKIATRIVKQGRNRGIGSTWISQQPHTLHTGILTQLEVLVCLRLMHHLDIRAIETWIGKHADAEAGKDLRDNLSGLPSGHAWWWSPSWLGVLRLVAMRPRCTYDSAMTPKPGHPLVEPEVYAQVDLEPLGLTGVVPELETSNETSPTSTDEQTQETIAATEAPIACAPASPGKQESQSLIQQSIRPEDVEPSLLPAVGVSPEIEALRTIVSALSERLVAGDLTELLRLRAEHSQLLSIAESATRDRDRALEELAGQRQAWFLADGHRATAHGEERRELQARNRALLEQVRTLEIEVSRLEAELERNGYSVARSRQRRMRPATG